MKKTFMFLISMLIVFSTVSVVFGQATEEEVFKCRVIDVKPAEETGTWLKVTIKFGYGKAWARACFVDSRAVNLETGDDVYVICFTKKAEIFGGDAYLIIPNEEAEDMIARGKWKLTDRTIPPFEEQEIDEELLQEMEERANSLMKRVDSLIKSIEVRIEKEVRAVLDKQVELWNAVNLEGFMDYYLKSEDITFQSGNGRILGWEALLTRYKTTYPKDKMGKLKFSNLHFEILSDEAVYVLGRFHLTYPDSSKEGLFTMILVKKPEGWRIIHDHVSS